MGWENVIEWSIKIAHLKAICPFIRFGLMSGKYFVKKVKPLYCLTEKECLDIMSHIFCKDESCGAFSTRKRIRQIELIPYTIESSPLYESDRDEIKKMLHNTTFAVLSNNDLSRGIGLIEYSTENQNLFITAKLKASYFIERVEIGALIDEVDHYWGSDDINGCWLQYLSTDKEWIDLKQIKAVENGLAWTYDELNIDTNALRIIRKIGSEFVGFGNLRIFGYRI